MASGWEGFGRTHRRLVNSLEMELGALAFRGFHEQQAGVRAAYDVLCWNSAESVHTWQN